MGVEKFLVPDEGDGAAALCVTGAATFVVGGDSGGEVVDGVAGVETAVGASHDISIPDAVRTIH